MSAAVANELLELARTCVGDCNVYDRQFISTGRPTIDCSTLAVSIGDATVVSNMASCTVFRQQYEVVVSMCCAPTMDADGNPPDPEAITAVTECLMADLDRLTCCLSGYQVESPEALRNCKTIITGKRVQPALGKCLTARVLLEVSTKVCCGED